MKAFAVSPGVKNSASVIDVPKPQLRTGEVLVRVLEVGICGTDSEINSALYGEAPSGEPLLILGHEALGELSDGRLVVPMVRRPCPECDNCRAGDQDMCSTSAFSERGIKGLHGAICEFIAEDPAFLINVPADARRFAVLVEPMSVVAKALRHALLIQSRMRWQPNRALVLGAGPIGLLAAFALRARGCSVTVVARKPAGSVKAKVAEFVGAEYHSTQQKPIRDLVASSDPFDLIFDATGSAQAAFDSIGGLAVNGVMCLTSVTGGSATASLPIDRINCDMVLGNRVIFGTVNANRRDHVDGLEMLRVIDGKFPGVLARLVTARVSFSGAADVFDIQQQGIKTVFDVVAA